MPDSSSHTPENADLPASLSLRALSEETGSPPLRRALRDLSDRLEAGETLDEALKHRRGEIPSELAMLFESGIDSNRIPHAIAGFVRAERDHVENRRRVRMSLAYPAIICVIGMGIMVFLLWYIAPQYSATFGDFDIELPGLTRVYLSLSRFVVTYQWYLLTGLVVLCAGGVTFYMSLRVRWSDPSLQALPESQVAQAARWSRFVNAIPLFGARRMDALAGFCRVLAIFIESGVPLPEALEAAGRGSRDADLLQGARQLANGVRAGNGLYESALVLPGLPKVLVNILRWEQQGDAFPEMLRSTAQTFSSRARVQAALVSLLAEPIAVLIVVSIVGLAVVALFLPLLSLLNYLS